MKVAGRVVRLIGNLNLLPQVAVLLLVLNVPGLAATQADSFDVPVKKQVVDFGPSPYSRGYRVKLSCYFYLTFMVKEYDEGQKGAEWLAILSFKEGMTPTCIQSHAVGEKVIVYPEWAGYFKGAKANLVFFHGDDGTNGGMPFVVYDSKTGSKVFEDSYYDASMGNIRTQNSPFNRLRVMETEDGRLSLKYLRVVEANCDLHREQASCWEQVRRKLELKSADMPVCSGYKNILTRWESVVAYPVEVSLFPQPVVKTTVGPVKCWPVD